jgi:hypothetical protein
MRYVASAMCGLTSDLRHVTMAQSNLTTAPRRVCATLHRLLTAPCDVTAARRDVHVALDHLRTVRARVSADSRLLFPERRRLIADPHRLTTESSDFTAARRPVWMTWCHVHVERRRVGADSSRLPAKSDEVAGTRCHVRSTPDDLTSVYDDVGSLAHELMSHARDFASAAQVVTSNDDRLSFGRRDLSPNLCVVRSPERELPDVWDDLTFTIGDPRSAMLTLASASRCLGGSEDEVTTVDHVLRAALGNDAVSATEVSRRSASYTSTRERHLKSRVSFFCS